MTRSLAHSPFAALALIGALGCAIAPPLPAQVPSQGGQDAFAAIAEVVRMLDADPRTDWSMVNLTALREHLRDMDDVVMLSEVSQAPAPGGLTMVVVGYGRTIGAIKRMVGAHARELTRVPGWRATSEPLTRGIRLTVTTDPSDTLAVSRIRALGFAGLLTVGAHHQQHHLAIARGAAHEAHGIGRPH
jgi:hypothetical protein